jgi:hypothetical protein
MTTREVVTRSGRGVRGYFPTRTMQQMIAWESTLERDAILMCEFSKRVTRYWAQPAKIYFYQNNEQKHCFPDLRIETPGGQLIHIEVKPAEKLKNPILRNRLQAIKEHHEKIGIGYEVHDESVIRVEPRLTNLKLLAYHLPPFNADLSRNIDSLEKLSLLNPQTVGGAIAILGDAQMVYQLLALGHYNFDIDLPISIETMITISKGGDHEELFL